MYACAFVENQKRLSVSPSVGHHHTPSMGKDSFSLKISPALLTYTGLIEANVAPGPSALEKKLLCKGRKTSVQAVI